MASNIEAIYKLNCNGNTTASDKWSIYSHTNACSYLSGCRICYETYREADGQQTAILAYAREVTETEAERIIEKYVDTIKANYRALCNTIKNDGDEVLRVWSSLKPVRRSKIVRKALEDPLQEKKWANFLITLENPPKSMKVRDREKFRSAFLLPSLCVEELANDPSRLLRLLELRRHHKPAEWAEIDHGTTRLGRASGMLEMEFSQAIFSVTGHDYGQLVGFVEDDFHRWNSIGYPVARILFEAQARLYSFLSNVAQLLAVEDFSSEDSGCDKWIAYAAELFDRLRPAELEYGADLCIPPNLFDRPPEFSLQGIKSVIEDRLDLVEEELWLLQTDNEHAYDKITAIAETDYVQAIARDQNDGEKWKAIALELTQPLQTRFRFWRGFEPSCNLLEKHLAPEEGASRLLDAFEPGIDLSEDANTALESFKDTIILYTMYELRQLIEDLLLRDKVFDHEFQTKTNKGNWKPANLKDRQRLVDNRKEKIRQPSKGSAADFQDSRLLWALLRLSSLGLFEAAWGPQQEIHCIADIAATDQGCKPAFATGTRLSQVLEDYSAALWISTCIRAYRPRSKQPANGKEGGNYHDERMLMLGDELTSIVGVAEKTINRSAWNWQSYFLGIEDGRKPEVDQAMRVQLTKAGQLLKKFYEIKLSFEREETLEWLRQAKKSKEALCEFWREIRRIKMNDIRSYDKEIWARHGSQLNSLKDVAVLRHCEDAGNLREINRSIERLEKKEEPPEEDEQAKPLTPSKRDRDEQGEAPIPVSSPKKPRLDQPEEVEEEKPKKDKIKTRPNGPPPEPIPAPPPLMPPPPPPERIYVSRKSLHTFARHWPSQSGVRKEGTVRWKHVLQAMGEAGFETKFKSGSAANFTEVKGTRKITFHAPHPGDEMPDEFLKKNGGRLTRDFNWTWSTFVEKKRTDEE